MILFHSNASNYWCMEENSETNPFLFKPIEARIELNMFKYPY